MKEQTNGFMPMQEQAQSKDREVSVFVEFRDESTGKIKMKEKIRIISELSLQEDQEEEMKSYYSTEEAILQKGVSSGILKEISALNGKMYVLPLDIGDFPIAIKTYKTIVRNGDIVQLRRMAPGGEYVEATGTIGEFYVNERNGEIGFPHIGDIPPMLRVNDIQKNISAISRRDQMKESVLK